VPDEDRTDPRYAAAERHVNRLGGWAVHVLAFLLVNAGIAAQSGFEPTAGHVWGWGLGVAAHTVAALGPGGALKERLIQRELHRRSTRTR
jgi:hypothetical protein